MAIYDPSPLLTISSGCTINLRLVAAVSPHWDSELGDGRVYTVYLPDIELEIKDSELPRDAFIGAWAKALNPQQG